MRATAARRQFLPIRPFLAWAAVIALVSAAATADAQDAQPPPPEPAAQTAPPAPATQAAQPTFTSDEIVAAASDFFGATSAAVGSAVERVFRDQGQPVGYIRGEEGAGAVGFGLRYGRGTLVMKSGEERPVYWQGPSIGFDTGINASRVFTLVYNLENPDGIYRRYPGVEGAAFYVAGVSVTYQRAEGVVLAPMRTGVGLRAGVNAGYTAYSRTRRWLPF